MTGGLSGIGLAMAEAFLAKVRVGVRGFFFFYYYYYYYFFPLSDGHTLTKTLGRQGRAPGRE